MFDDRRNQLDDTTDLVGCHGEPRHRLIGAVRLVGHFRRSLDLAADFGGRRGLSSVTAATD
ncbi:hypothetical protein [Bradyrhizobium roseum]|uniref:hypothetical protein n=1 Tax=Bradyrhizobium roseum TaxID=3056648 RepID=UPI002628BEA1|nr:hypothetical protein [Bradyrhizobium roseus]WKA26166.1 hypothetical protein QUH67_21390 [Bradyrhizobium roseus]